MLSMRTVENATTVRTNKRRNRLSDMCVHRVGGADSADSCAPPIYENGAFAQDDACHVVSFRPRGVSQPGGIARMSSAHRQFAAVGERLLVESRPAQESLEAVDRSH